MPENDSNTSPERLSLMVLLIRAANETTEQNVSGRQNRAILVTLNAHVLRRKNLPQGTLNMQTAAGMNKTSRNQSFSDHLHACRLKMPSNAQN
jgi:hypothetical protein